jgi:hypothetical protein
MTTIAHHEPRPVTGGVDTHKDLHVAAVLDELCRLLATGSFPTTRHGYRRLLRWGAPMVSSSPSGVEGCGSWGAGLARFLAAPRGERGRGEPTQPPEPPPARQVRHRRRRGRRPGGAGRPGHGDAQGGHGPRRDGPPAAYHPLMAVAERWRPGSQPSAEAAAKRALATVARRWRSLDDEARELSRHIKAIPRRRRSRADRQVRRRLRDRRPAPRHRRRQPRSTPPRAVVRRSLRRLPGASVLRSNQPSSPQPRRRPPSQLGAVDHRAGEDDGARAEQGPTSSAGPPRGSPSRRSCAA